MKKIYFYTLIILILLSALLSPQIVKSSTNNVVISEVQISGDGIGSADDEFIELYNPTNNVIDIHSWSIQRETTGGTFLKKNFVAPANIPAHGYYLISNTNYNGTVAPDLSHSSFTLSSTGTTVFLVSNQVLLTTGDEATIVDKVGLGSLSLDSEVSPFATVPPANSSIERIGDDTDNNSVDFHLRAVSDPQNSQSIVVTPSPTATTSPTPTSTPTPSPTDTPTPTASPTPTEIPTSTPTEIPTLTPSPTPVETSTPTASPISTSAPKGWLKSPVFTCSNPNIPGFVYQLLKLLMPSKFNCG